MNKLRIRDKKIINININRKKLKIKDRRKNKKIERKDRIGKINE